MFPIHLMIQNAYEIFAQANNQFFRCLSASVQFQSQHIL